jgi:hypothetical protein
LLHELLKGSDLLQLKYFDALMEVVGFQPVGDLREGGCWVLQDGELVFANFEHA